jgi:flagellar secretion chaperone FliS
VNKRLETYQDTETLSKPPVDLLLKVYDGSLQSFAGASEAYVRGDFTAGYDQLEKARRFVVHLYTTLDFDKGGEIADRLGRLYVFVMNEIDFIEATKQTARIDGCIKVLQNIREGWVGLKPARSTSQNRVPTDGQDTNRLEQTLEFTA